MIQEEKIFSVRPGQTGSSEQRFSATVNYARKAIEPYRPHRHRPSNPFYRCATSNRNVHRRRYSRRRQNRMGDTGRYADKRRVKQSLWRVITPLPVRTARLG